MFLAVWTNANVLVELYATTRTKFSASFALFFFLVIAISAHTVATLFALFDMAARLHVAAMVTLDFWS